MCIRDSFYDPLILAKINQGILNYLDRQGLVGLAQLTGSLRLHGQPVPACGC